MALDARGLPTHACPECGCMLFNIRAMFENSDIAMWFTDGTCCDCGTQLTVPTPADKNYDI